MGGNGAGPASEWCAQNGMYIRAKRKGVWAGPTKRISYMGKNKKENGESSKNQEERIQTSKDGKSTLVETQQSRAKNTKKAKKERN